jgi:cell division protein FtsB
MSRQGSAGRGPSGKRSTPSTTQRSRAAGPSRRAPVEDERPRTGRQTAITARAAILVLALASVMVAVAVPFKIWLGQRGDMASLATQTRQTELRLARLNAEDKRWQNPTYVEAQARKRLHYTLPGVTTHIVLGRPSHPAPTAGGGHQAAATGPWYSEFWQSMETAGKSTATK